MQTNFCLCRDDVIALVAQAFLCLPFAAVLRVAGSLQKSTEVMKAMQNLIKIPEIQATMRELSKEMMKVGPVMEIRLGWETGRVVAREHVY